MNLKSTGYKDDQWVLATNVMQVAYYIYPEDTKRHVVVSGSNRSLELMGYRAQNNTTTKKSSSYLPIYQRR
jgi:hypothetical protein